MPFGMEKKLEWWIDLADGEKIEEYIMFIRFDTIHESKGRPDRQTPHDGTGRAPLMHSIARQ